MASFEEKAKKYLEKVNKALVQCVDFWNKHSEDTIHGGFFTCLTREGKVYDETKYAWLQGRQIFMYAKLYNELPEYKNEDILGRAIRGAAFMVDHMKQKDTWKCVFSTTRDGRPIKIQRTIFSETFYVLGFSELYRATKNPVYLTEATTMFDKIVHWREVDRSGLGRPLLEGAKGVIAMGEPMMILSLAMQLDSVEPHERYRVIAKRCVDEILLHAQRDGQFVLENVSPIGEELPGSAGRVMLPGHALECGWFLLDYIRKYADNSVKEITLQSFILRPLEYGWDKQHGGLFYFLDVDGYCPTQLEWNMKLWWAHNEALIALLMAYRETKDEQFFVKFDEMFTYSWDHFQDDEFGEWYGYLNQKGEVNQSFKGGSFKGFFHVPRCLLMCRQLLEELISH